MRLFKFIAIIILPFTLFLLVMFFLAFNLDFYRSQHPLSSTPAPLDENLAALQAQDVYGYLNHNQDQLTFTYTEKERLHLADIKNIIFLFKIITLVLIILTIASWILIYLASGLDRLIKDIFWSNIFSLAFYLALIIAMMLYFDQLFLLFHQLMFRNNYWQLDPETENLINVFPPQFFADLLAKIMQNVLAINVVIIIILSIVVAIRKKTTLKTS